MHPQLIVAMADGQVHQKSLVMHVGQPRGLPRR